MRNSKTPSHPEHGSIAVPVLGGVRAGQHWSVSLLLSLSCGCLRPLTPQGVCHPVAFIDTRTERMHVETQ